MSNIKLKISLSDSAPILSLIQEPISEIIFLDDRVLIRSDNSSWVYLMNSKKLYKNGLQIRNDNEVVILIGKNK